MTFRDETEALRQRVTILEAELERRSERVEELTRQLADRAELEKRVAELEAELAKYRPKPKPEPEPTPGPAPVIESTRPSYGRFVAVGAAVVAGIVLYAYVDGLWPFAPELELRGSPTSGTVDLATFASAPRQSATVEGLIDASEIHAGCRGYVPSRPLLVVHTAQRMPVRLEASSGADTVLVLRAANGAVYCDDDSGVGQNPLLERVIGAGEHRVWVGTYAEDGEADVAVSVARGSDPRARTIDVTAEPVLGTFDANGATDGTVFGVISAGSTSAGCAGYLPVAPHAVLRLDRPREVRLWTTNSDNTDLVMLVRAADGTIHCDDDGAKNYMPLVVANLPAGDHRVWVGTYSPRTNAEFTLHAESE